MMQQQAQDQPLREATRVERIDEQATPRRALHIEALEARVAPTVVNPNPGWGD